MATMWLMMYVLVGGMDSFFGPIIGTFVLILIPESLRDLKIYAPFVSAVILGIVVYLMPKGLAGLFRALTSWRRGDDRGEASRAA